MHRLYAALLAAFMTVSCFGLVTVSSQAVSQQTKPERALSERPPGEHQIDFRSFALKGRVEELQADGTLVPYAGRKVLLQKRTCKACPWKPNKELKTNDRGVYLTRIFSPRAGQWFWRVRIKGSGDYATTTGLPWATGNQRNG